MKKNVLVFGTLGLITVVYAWFLLSYFVPGIPGGGNQNAYHGFARDIADHGRFYRTVGDEFEYVGAMWVENDRHQFFPKYPPGYPALIGATNRIFGTGAGFYLTVAGAVSAVPALYCVARFFMPQLFALLAAWMLVLTPEIAWLGISRNSHTPSLALFLWGMAAFLGAAHTRKYRYAMPLAFLGGLLIGFCTGIRYTDFLLIAVPGIYALCYFRGKRFWLITAALGLGAAIPYGAIAYFHYWAFGSIFRSGYSLTGEDSAFKLSSLALNLRLYLPDILRDGVGPAAVLMFALLLRPGRYRWKRVLFWGSWILPTLGLYLTYYWAPDGKSASYLRFLVPLLPAFYLLGAGGLRLLLAKRNARTVYWAVAVTAALQLVWGLPGIINHCETKALEDRKLALNINFAKTNLPPGALLLATESILNELDFEENYLLYPTSMLNVAQINRITEQTIRGEALWLQKARAEALQQKLGTMRQADLSKLFIERFKAMLKDGKKIYFYGSSSEARRLRNFFQNYFELKETGSSPGEVPASVFVAVNVGSNRYGIVKRTQNVAVMELWELVAARDKAPTELERETSLQEERTDLARQLGDDGGERTQMLNRYENTVTELTNLRVSRSQREAAARAKAENERKLREKRVANEKTAAEPDNRAKTK